ncbi:hypothetical protein B0H14DRAFT_2564406 [Mycena olivaceomarginata]|nr:hypothetical protein B0H14DRAFT_2564406 [Mycena olivaceomarginata]
MWPPIRPPKSIYYPSSRARIYDAREAASIRAARETCILTNRNNSDQVRMQRIVTRAARRHSYRQGHDEVGDAITAAQQSLSTLTDEKKAVTALLKDLKAQHKELGRVSSTMDVENETPESDVEQALSPLLPSSSPVSSPGPLLRPLDDDSEMFPATISVDVPEASSDPSGFPLQSDASASAPSATFSDLSTSFDLSFDLSPGDIDFINDFDFTTLAIPLGTHDSFDATQTGSSSAPSSTMPSDWPAKSYGGNWKRPTGALRMTPTVGEERYRCIDSLD